MTSNFGSVVLKPVLHGPQVRLYPWYGINPWDHVVSSKSWYQMNVEMVNCLLPINPVQIKDVYTGHSHILLISLHKHVDSFHHFVKCILIYIEHIYVMPFWYYQGVSLGEWIIIQEGQNMFIFIHRK